MEGGAVKDFKDAEGPALRQERRGVVSDEPLSREKGGPQEPAPGVAQVCDCDAAVLLGNDAGDAFTKPEGGPFDAPGEKPPARGVFQHQRVRVQEQHVRGVHVELRYDVVDKIQERDVQVQAGGDDEIDGVQRVKTLEAKPGLLLYRPAHRDILAGAEGPGDSPLLVSDDGVVPCQDPLLAGHGHHRELEICKSPILTRQQPQKDRASLFSHPLWNKAVEKVLFFDLPFFVSENFGPLFVDELHGLISADDQDEDAGNIKVLLRPVFFPLQRLLCPLALGDVAKNALDDFFAAYVDAVRADLNRDLATTHMKYAEGVRNARTCPNDFLEKPAALLRIFGRMNLRIVHPHEVCRGQAEEFPRLFVRLDDQPRVRVEHEDGVIGVFDQRAVFFLRFLYPPFGPLAGQKLAPRREIDDHGAREDETPSLVRLDHGDAVGVGDQEFEDAVGGGDPEHSEQRVQEDDAKRGLQTPAFHAEILTMTVTALLLKFYHIGICSAGRGVTS